jgi:hypothetical protein
MSLLQRKLGETPEGSPDAAILPAPPVAGGQRVRVGLTGLAAIFLLVLVATAGLRPGVHRGAPQAADEPLAVLGVAPAAPDDRPPVTAPAPPQ